MKIKSKNKNKNIIKTTLKIQKKKKFKNKHKITKQTPKDMVQSIIRLPGQGSTGLPTLAKNEYWQEDPVLPEHRILTGTNIPISLIPKTKPG